MTRILTVENAKELAKIDFKNNDVADYQSQHAIEQGVNQDAAHKYAMEIISLEIQK